MAAMPSTGRSISLTDTAGQRGLRVVVVVDQSVSARQAALMLWARLSDELPPEWVRVFSVGQPAWERALGLESAMAASLEPGGIVWPDGYDPYQGYGGHDRHGASGRTGDVPDLVDGLAELGLPATASWSPTGWRATLRRAVTAEIGGDLVLAVSGRRRPLPCGMGRRHRVELLTLLGR